jgi:hypothetical protein
MGVSEEKVTLTAKEREEGERLDGFVFVTSWRYRTSGEYQSRETTSKVILMQLPMAKPAV